MKQIIQKCQEDINNNTELFKKWKGGEKIIDEIKKIETNSKLSDSDITKLIKNMETVVKMLNEECYGYADDGIPLFQSGVLTEREYNKIRDTIENWLSKLRQNIKDKSEAKKLSEYFDGASKKIDNFKDYIRQSLNYTTISELQKIALDCKDNADNVGVYCKLLPHIFFMIDELPRLKVATKYQLKFDKEIKDFIETARNTGLGNMIDNFKAIRSIDDSTKPFNLVNNEVDISGKTEKDQDNVK